jgi:hypothetical protein
MTEGVFIYDGYYTCGLRIGELIELQEKLGVGPYILAQRLQDGSWLVQDIKETLRLGLIGGGGVTPKQALDLAERAVVPGHLIDMAGTAGAIIMTALLGVEDEPLEDKADPLMAPTMTDEGSSNGEVSTASEGPVDSPPPKSKKCRSGSSAKSAKDGDKPTEAEVKKAPRPRKATSKTLSPNGSISDE